MKQERILIRSVNWLGDAIMVTPALLRLRAARPGAEISLLTAEKLAELWEHHPAVDKVLTFRKGAPIREVARELKKHAFHRAIALPNSTRSGLELWMARIPERYGYPGRGRPLLLNRIVPRTRGIVRMRKRTPAEVKRLVTEQPTKGRDSYPTTSHQVHEYLHLVAALGADPTPLSPKIEVTAEEQERFRMKFQVPPGRILGINPGAEYGPAKRWPVENFIEAVRMVARKERCTWMIFGAKADQPAAEAIAGSLGGSANNLAGRTSLRELCVGLSLCEVLLTNDTGPMHLASALGTRVVVPFGSTSPELTGPTYDPDARHAILLGQAPCAPCFLRECPVDFRCMRSIEPTAAAEAMVSGR